MEAVGAEVLLVVDLMEIAWMLNLRGKDDIPYNPVFYRLVPLSLPTARPSLSFA